MILRTAALLCLTGLGACSNTNSEPARAPSETTADADANLRPASFESDRSNVATTTPRDPATVDAVSPGAAAPLTAEPRSADGSAMTGDGRVGDARTDQARTDQARTDAGAAQPDNTKVNERDRNSAALTPGDQGNNQTDLDITKRIRQGVMADGSLSFTAKNVKIITTGGRVTLRGPVSSEHERDAIYAAARQVVASDRIDNQIEVKK